MANVFNAHLGQGQAQGASSSSSSSSANAVAVAEQLEKANAMIAAAEANQGVQGLRYRRNFGAMAGGQAMLSPKPRGPRRSSSPLGKTKLRFSMNG